MNFYPKLPMTFAVSSDTLTDFGKLFHSKNTKLLELIKSREVFQVKFLKAWLSGNCVLRTFTIEGSSLLNTRVTKNSSKRFQFIFVQPQIVFFAINWIRKMNNSSVQSIKRNRTTNEAVFSNNSKNYSFFPYLFVFEINWSLNWCIFYV